MKTIILLENNKLLITSNTDMSNSRRGVHLSYTVYDISSKFIQTGFAEISSVLQPVSFP